MKKIFKLLPLVLVASLTACDDMETFSKTDYLFGTFCSFSIKSYRGYSGMKTAQEFYEILKTYDAISDYHERADVVNVYTLNNTNEKVKISEELYGLLSRSNQLAESVEYFNPLVGSLSDKWKASLANNQVLSDEVIAEELAKINNSSLVLEKDDEGYYAQRVGDAQIDLGAIAKGYALDKCHQLAKHRVCDDRSFDLGSSSLMFGKSSKKKFNGETVPNYYVRVKDLEEETYLQLTYSFVSTSGVSEQLTVIDGQKYSHIINPTTGSAISNYDAVIVVSDERDDYGSLGDVLSTSLMLASSDKFPQVEQDLEVDILAIKDGNIVYMSEDLPLYKANGQKVTTK